MIGPPREARAWAAIALAIAVPGVSSRASAEPFRIGAIPAWYVLGGATGGGTVGVDQKGGFVGGELSVVRLRQGRYIGGYADAYYDFGIDGTYTTAGVEVGKQFVGLDAGVALRFAGDTEIGGTARVFVSVGVFSVFARYAYFNSDTDDHVIQLGAMLKLPLHSPFGGHR
ncbi:MAG: hypothetical protein K8W52_27400 [Deltaproteobacteria bacterium]|nr:hypothetical protein [Deltaproteobacteria bacterium]